MYFPKVTYLHLDLHLFFLEAILGDNVTKNVGFNYFMIQEFESKFVAKVICSRKRLKHIN